MDNLTADADAIGKMTDHEFAQYWEALGTIVKLTTRAKTRTVKPAEREHDCVAASTERKWSRHVEADATAFGFSREPST